MNAIVVTALKRPYTFVVLAILILLYGGMAVFKTPTDIFPPIKIPIVAVVWTYTGLMPTDMSGRVVYYYERALTTTVSGIEHIESQSLYGSGIVKIFFQPGTDVAAAQAQVTAISQTVIKQLPEGITPPLVLAYDASSVPVLDLQIAADNMTPADIYNVASNMIRPALVSVPGAAIPAPYGGTLLNVEVDIDPAKLLEHGLSAADVGHALANQNIVLPAGDQKIGAIDYMVATNSTPIDIDTFNNMPIKQVGNAVVYLRDVAYVHHGGPPQHERGSGERAPVDPAADPQERRRLDAGRRRRRAGHAAAIAQDTAARRDDHAAERRLHLRARLDRGRGAGNGDRRVPGRHHRPAVRRQLALHPDRRHLHSAVDPELDPGAVLAWRDDQCHDAGRPRAGRRHPGR